MSTTGKIRTLFSDIEKTEPLFPRTKTSAVSNDKGVGLDALMEHLAYTDINPEDVAVVPVDADTLGGLPASNYASQAFVTNKIAEAQLGGGEGGDIDLSGYATKDDINTVSNKVGDTPVSTQINEAITKIDYPVDSVNGKTGAVQLSASDVGARPDDWTPTASDVGAVPNTRKVNGKVLSEDITLSAADVGASPAGFGYGGKMPYINLTSGTYSGMELSAALDSVLATMEDGAAAQVQIYDPDSNYHSNRCFGKLWKYGKNATLEVINYSGYKAILRRLSDRGWLTEWEWENPPMTDDVEYRTLERFDGKPVYVKSINCGNMPTENAKISVEYSSSPVFPIRINGRTRNGQLIPSTFVSTSVNPHIFSHIYVYADGTDIYIYSTEDHSGTTAVITIWYTKSN